MNNCAVAVCMPSVQPAVLSKDACSNRQGRVCNLHCTLVLYHRAGVFLPSFENSLTGQACMQASKQAVTVRGRSDNSMFVHQ